MNPNSFLTTSLLPLLFLLSRAPSPSYASPSPLACNNSPTLCPLPYNKITYLGAHDSPFLRNPSTNNSLSGDQFYPTTTQLADGVRLLTAQVYRLGNGTLQLCHTNCLLLNAGTLESWLQEIGGWMRENENEVVTVLLVNADGVGAGELGAVYERTGVRNVSFVPEEGARKGGIGLWPTLGEMVRNGTRLVTFVASLADNSAAPFLLDEFTYIFENSYNNTRPNDFSCQPDRPSSVAGNIQAALKSGLMPLQNHFLYDLEDLGIEIPSVENINTTNSPGNPTGNLGFAAEQCKEAYGRPASFLLVDYFNEGPAIEVVDRLNGVTDPVGRSTTGEQLGGSNSSGTSNTTTTGNNATSTQSSTSQSTGNQDEGKPASSSSDAAITAGPSLAMLWLTVLAIALRVT